MEPSPDLQRLIRPSSIAIVGASPRPLSSGSITLNNLINAGYEGRLYAVNPKYEEILGVKCYRSINELPEAVDSAILCVPAISISHVLEEAGNAGVRSAIVYASGFAEADEKGHIYQSEIHDIATSFGMPICGPNCLGIVNLRDRYYGFGTSVSAALPCGRVSAVCQSGSIGIALLNSGRGIGFNYLVSSGNEAVITVEDYLEFFAEDDATDVILAFVEGFRNIAKLREVASLALECDKPIIVIKVGRSAVARRAALAHTGSLAGSDAVHDAFFKQAGIIRATDLDEALETTALLLRSPRPKGGRIGVIAISGGEVGLLADLSDEIGLQFATISDDTVMSIREVVPPFIDVGNPLDAGWVGDEGQTYAACLERMGGDPQVDIVAVCQDAPIGFGPDLAGEYEPLAQAVVKAAGKLNKPIILFSNISGGFQPNLRKILDEGGIPTLQGTSESLRAIRHLIDFASYRKGLRTQVNVEQNPERQMRALRLLTRSCLTEHESKQLLREYGIRITRERLVHTVGEAIDAAEEIGYPIALKIDSPDIQHKTDIGAIRLNIANSGALEAAYDEVLYDTQRSRPEARIGGMLVQEMLNIEHACEVIAGLAYDNQFGPTILFGLGGTLVEALHDVTLRVSPLSVDDAWSMLEELRGSAILNGIRGKPPADRQAIVDVLLCLSDLSIELDERISEIDINPLLVFPQGEGAVAADALVVCSGMDTK
jgi:acyl-CoA synthetase (NDP forming)